VVINEIDGFEQESDRKFKAKWYQLNTENNTRGKLVPKGLEELLLK
jgi:hypothetical protein